MPDGGNDSKFEKHPIIFFDGVCNLCNRVVRFVIRHDVRGIFRFGLLQSEKAQELLKPFGFFAFHLTTIVLLDNNLIYTESDAILKIAKRLHGNVQLLYYFILVPKFIRDAFYRLISRHRFKIFGKRKNCIIPAPESINRFI